MNQNRFGLQDSDMDVINKILMNYDEIEEAYIFGSRAKGNYRQGSDVDIALKGEDIKRSQVLEISDLLNEETNMPYRFDIVHFDSIDRRELSEHILRVKKVIYRRVANLVLQEPKTKYNTQKNII
ncbi:MAG: hypothetical protein AMXMBFR51_29340 [Ignavibacteriota bacterium]